MISPKVKTTRSVHLHLSSSILLLSHHHWMVHDAMMLMTLNHNSSFLGDPSHHKPSTTTSPHRQLLHLHYQGLLHSFLDINLIFINFFFLFLTINLCTTSSTSTIVHQRSFILSSSRSVTPSHHQLIKHQRAHQNLSNSSSSYT